MLLILVLLLLIPGVCMADFSQDYAPSDSPHWGKPGPPSEEEYVEIYKWGFVSWDLKPKKKFKCSPELYGAKECVPFEGKIVCVHLEVDKPTGNFICEEIEEGK